ncbi:hypothetical protein G5B35_10265 [Parapusillimonas sp. SGNA-6]|jgi:lipopolysaccharide biosynthesis regulator YciM|nr:hypothetical protein [Parapusillimonas sp. SGNA-6]
MKPGIILLSLLAAAATWWWMSRRQGPARRSLRDTTRLVSRSFVAGLAVYFIFMAVALLYLTVTTR